MLEEEQFCWTMFWTVVDVVDVNEDFFSMLQGRKREFEDVEHIIVLVYFVDLFLSFLLYTLCWAKHYYDFTLPFLSLHLYLSISLSLSLSLSLILSLPHTCPYTSAFSLFQSLSPIRSLSLFRILSPVFVSHKSHLGENEVAQWMHWFRVRRIGARKWVLGVVRTMLSRAQGIHQIIK
jgi:hypothetical protein